MNWRSIWFSYPDLGRTDFFVRNVPTILEAVKALPPEIYDGRQDLCNTLSAFAVEIAKAMKSPDLSLNMQLRILQSYEETRETRSVCYKQDTQGLSQKIRFLPA